MMVRVIAVVLLVLGVWQLGQAGLVQGKAWLGQQLLERAWQRAIIGEEQVSPWPGAVSHPVARLHMARLDIDYLVLDGLDTPVLAWGPGMETGPGGHRVVAAHRDTHFRFLAEIEHGDRLLLEHGSGRTEHWQVKTIEVIDSRQTRLDMGLSRHLLTLVTCYPFDAASAGGPLRYVVRLTPADEDLT